MTPFAYSKATSEPDAIARGGKAATKFLGAGTNLVDLMREQVESAADVF